MNTDAAFHGLLAVALLTVGGVALHLLVAMPTSDPMMQALAVVGLLSGVVAIALGVAFAAVALDAARRADDRVADYLTHLPVVGPRVTRRCSRCGHFALRGRTEAMPVAFGDEQGIATAVIHFCTSCSREMTLQDRLTHLNSLREQHAEREAASSTNGGL